MRIHIWYFSGTGNTWYISNHIARALALRESRVTLSSIESADPPQVEQMLDECDVIGIGYPVYGSDLPSPMKQFLRSLPVPPHPVDLFVFCTQWLFSGDGTQAALEFLPSRQYRVRWSEHLFMPNNVCVSALRLPYTNDPKRIARRGAQQIPRISRLADHIVSGSSSHRGFGILPALLGSLQRSPFRRFFSSLQNDFTIDQSVCTRCGLCSKICPVENLTFGHDKIVVPQGRCILCLRCYNFCPVQAVVYRGRGHISSRGIPYRGPDDFNPREEKKRWHKY